MEYIIEVEGFKKHFRTVMTQRKVEAVKDVSFKVKPGEIFGFLGPNGAGKTTTMKAMMGLIRPTGGTIRILGGEPGQYAVMSRVGFLPEQPYFYDYLKPQELLHTFGRIFSIPRAVREKRIDELLRLVGLEDARNKTLRKFSKGMLQRIGIAQALINDPELIVLDEPLSGLDPIGRKEVIDLLASLKSQGKTVFFSSHILSDIERLCDRVVIIDKGLVKAEGTLEQLLGSGSGEKEILVGGLKDVASVELLAGVKSVEVVGSLVHRLVVENAQADEVLMSLLKAGLHIVSVSDQRISLESLFISQSGGGPAMEATI